MKRMLRVAASVLIFPAALCAQDLVKDALRSFPPDTIRIEYSNPRKLRTLPNYQSLRQRYAGPRLQKLVDSLAQIGIREDDVDELLLGFRLESTEADLYGFANGRFDSRTLAERAAAQGIPPTTIAGQQAYCLGASVGSPCVATLSNARGAFGTLTSLTSLLEARAGQSPGLASNELFVRLASEAPTSSSIWGVALGPAVADWFKGWMPGQGNIQMDWGSVFQSVDALTYGVDAGQQVNIQLKLSCRSEEAAASLRQVLEGLKLAQQLAWQSNNPGRVNPYQNMQVNLKGSQVSVGLTAEYAALAGAGS
ncbi:MAG TPA: hypothetical protein VFD30_13180 [Terriglobia bacterium]|nr:hypothetical protein [Terriglobia bacterium]